MSESKKEWKVVDGYYPGFLNIVGASYTVSIVTSATDLTIEDYVNRTNDAHLMAAAPDLLDALELVEQCGFDDEDESGWGVIRITKEDWIEIKCAISKARGQQ